MHGELYENYLAPIIGSLPVYAQNPPLSQGPPPETLRKVVGIIPLFLEIYKFLNYSGVEVGRLNT
jgi:hypothetical protein